MKSTILILLLGASSQRENVEQQITLRTASEHSCSSAIDRLKDGPENYEHII